MPDNKQQTAKSLQPIKVQLVDVYNNRIIRPFWVANTVVSRSPVAGCPCARHQYDTERHIKDNVSMKKRQTNTTLSRVAHTVYIATRKAMKTNPNARSKLVNPICCPTTTQLELTVASIIFAHVHVIRTALKKSLGVKARGLSGAKAYPKRP